MGNAATGYKDRRSLRPGSSCDGGDEACVDSCTYAVNVCTTCVCLEELRRGAPTAGFEDGDEDTASPGNPSLPLAVDNGIFASLPFDTAPSRAPPQTAAPQSAQRYLAHPDKAASFKAKSTCSELVLASPRTASTSVTSEPQSVVIELRHAHTMADARNGGELFSPLSCILAHKVKLIAAGLCLVCLISLGSYLFRQFLRIPGLNEQIQELTTEVDRLQGQVTRLSDEVDRLAHENDRFALLNSELETNVATFAQQNTILNSRLADLEHENRRFSTLNTELHGTVNVLHREVTGLNSTVQQLQGVKVSLEQEVVNLERQNTIFNSSLHTLEIQVGLLRQENMDFRQSIAALEQIRSGLNGSVISLSQQNHMLNTSIGSLSDQVSDLSEQNLLLNSSVHSFRDENDRLHQSIAELELVRSNLNRSVISLTQQNLALNMSINLLSLEVYRLLQQNMLLNTTVNSLLVEVRGLESQNSQFRQSNGKLISLVSFLNTTASSVERSFDGLKDFLLAQIQTERVLVLESIHATSDERVASWRCSLNDAFGTAAFVANGQLTIDLPRLPQVLSYVEEVLLSELCVNKTDFELYLDRSYNLTDSLSLTELAEGVRQYTTQVLDFHFPDEDSQGSGTTPLEWEQAGYRCARLPRQFRFPW
mmetsp:Transcript_84556/g.234470  ORF Transcript_84556/g.234470 Transcript_84556/m.234470 type:complete len:651 (+) Transcript_84556:76-2028(+)